VVVVVVMVPPLSAGVVYAGSVGRPGVPWTGPDL